MRCAVLLLLAVTQCLSAQNQDTLHLHQSSNSHLVKRSLRFSDFSSWMSSGSTGSSSVDDSKESEETLDPNTTKEGKGGGGRQGNVNPTQGLNGGEKNSGVGYIAQLGGNDQKVFKYSPEKNPTPFHTGGSKDRFGGELFRQSPSRNIPTFTDSPSPGDGLSSRNSPTSRDSHSSNNDPSSGHLNQDFRPEDTRTERDITEAGNHPVGGHAQQAGLHARLEESESEHEHPASVSLAGLKWEEVKQYFILTSFVLLAGLVKVGFHHTQFLSHLLPESCLLIILGTIVGGILHAADATDVLPAFTTDAFFNILLPPIILESAYSLHDRVFFDNIGTILLYAVVGTLFNTFAIGGTLFGLYEGGAVGDGLKLTFLSCLVFSSLISAVDPVAVLAIFSEIGVNKDLYFLVFGESLLNDAVTIVLYNTMVALIYQNPIVASQYPLAFFSFFTVSLGGLLIGIIFGVLTALLTKYTFHVRVVEPLAMLAMAYLSYLTADLFEWSGIIAIIGCGLLQARYANKNISSKSYITVKYFIKMLSAISDCIIFLFLGMELWTQVHKWHVGFVFWTLLLCLVYRFIGVFFLTWIVNKFRLRRINIEEQMIMAYGGLRGAVAFSLVSLLKDDDNLPKDLFVTTTLIVIMCTVFIQGGTIKPLVNLLKIKRSHSGYQSLSEEIGSTTAHHIMAGLEEIIGRRGSFYRMARLRNFNETYVKKFLLRNPDEATLNRVFQKVVLSDHYVNLYGPVTCLEEGKVVTLHKVATASTELEAIDREEHQMADVLKKEEEHHKRQSLRRGSTKKRLGSIREVFHMKGMGGSRREEPPTEEEEDSAEASRMLKKAFADNPYAKYYNRFNKNLIDDEEQELSSHLRRRHLNARRMSHMAASSRLGSIYGHPDEVTDRRDSSGPGINRYRAATVHVHMPKENGESSSNGPSVQDERRRSVSAADAETNHYNYGVQTIIERARQRSSKYKNRQPKQQPPANTTNALHYGYGVVSMPSARSHGSGRSSVAGTLGRVTEEQDERNGQGPRAPPRNRHMDDESLYIEIDKENDSDSESKAA